MREGESVRADEVEVILSHRNISQWGNREHLPAIRAHMVW